MFDLRNELRGVVDICTNLKRQPQGAVIQFMGTRNGVGVSTCARALARIMAPRDKKPLWLMDLNFYENTQYRFFASRRAQGFYGAIGAARDAALGQQPFWRVHPALTRQDGRKAGDRYYLRMHQVGQHHLLVSHFRNDLLRPGQGVSLRPAKAYWQSLRHTAGLTIIDAPPLGRSKGGLVSALAADGVICVADPRDGLAGLHHLRACLEARGARCLGVVFNAPGRSAHTTTQVAAQ